MRKHISRLCIKVQSWFYSLFMTADIADIHQGLTAYEGGDFATALRKFQPLADAGDADAQFGLGLMCAKSEGVPQNDIQAHLWANLAADKGHEGAAKLRDIAAKAMSTVNVAEAQQCQASGYANC